MQLYRIDFYSIKRDEIMTLLRVSEDRKKLIQEISKKYKAHPESIKIKEVNKVDGYLIQLVEQ